jgi:hypothetical protein
MRAKDLDLIRAEHEGQRLALSNNWSVKGEYLFIGLDNHSLTIRLRLSPVGIKAVIQAAHEDLEEVGQTNSGDGFSLSQHRLPVDQPRWPVEL